MKHKITVKLSWFLGAIPSKFVACTESLGYVHPRPQHYMDVSGQLQIWGKSNQCPMDKRPF